MSADSTMALGADAFARAQPRPMPAPSQAAPTQAPAAAAPAQAIAAKEKIAASLALPDKAELTIDPRQRRHDLQEAIAAINQKMRQDGRALAFSHDEATNRTVVTVTNSETGKVVRQLPDESVLRFARNLDELKGMLQDDFA